MTRSGEVRAGDGSAGTARLRLRYEGQVLGPTSLRERPDPEDMENLPPGASFDVPPSGILVGRVPNTDVKIFSPWVARRHARLWATPEGIAMEDLGSTNGTTVNGAHVTQATLRPGDRVSFASYEFVVVAADTK